MRQFTLANAISEWRAATGAGNREIDRRVVLLQDSGFLPTTRERATALNLSKLTIGLLADESHYEASETAMRLFDAVCVESTASHPLFQPGTTLGIALAATFRVVKRRELTVHRLLFRFSGNELAAGLSITGVPGTIADAAFMADDDEAGPTAYAPIERTIAIHGNVIHDLAELVAESSTARSRAALAERNVSYETKQDK